MTSSSSGRRHERAASDSGRDGTAVSGLVPVPAGYAELLEQPKGRVRASRVRAARAANSELLTLYSSVGRDILNRQEQVGWGCRVIDRLVADLREEFPDQRAGRAATCSTCGRWPRPGQRGTACSMVLHNCPEAP